MKNGYIFRDTFNDRVISRHRTESGAVRSAIRFWRAFRKNNLDGSYLPTELAIIDDGKQVGILDYAEETNASGFVCMPIYDHE